MRITNLEIDAASCEPKAHVDDGFPGLMFGGGAKTESYDLSWDVLGCFEVRILFRFQ